MSDKWNAPDLGEDVQMPLGTGGGDAAPVEEYTGGGSRFKFNTSTIALVASFAAAIVVLYLIRYANQPRAASAAEATQAQQTEERIRQWLATSEQQLVGFGSDADRIIAIIQKYWEKSLTIDMGSDPLGERVVVKPPSGPGPTTKPVDASSFTRAEIVLMREIEEERLSLRLQLVMVGSPTAALISNGLETKMVQKGTLLKQLRVVDIQPGYVLVDYDGPLARKEICGPWKIETGPKLNPQRGGPR